MRTLSLALPTLASVVPLSSAALAAPQIGFDGGLRQEFDELVIFDADGDLGTTGDQVRVTGQAGLDVDTALKSSTLAGPESSPFFLELDSDAVAVAALVIEADVAASFDELILLPVTLPPVPIVTLALPAGLTIEINVVFKAAVQLEGSLEAGARAELGLEIPFAPKFEYDPGLGVESETDPFNHLFTSTPELSGGASGSVTARVLAAVEFQPWIAPFTPLPGPSFLVGARGSLDVEPAQDPWWRVRPGFDVFFHFGVLGVSTVIPPTLLEAYELPQIDAGGPVGAQPPAERYAKNYDLGLFDVPSFVMEAHNAPSRSFFGTESSVVGFIENDGSIANAWSWLSHTPLDAAPQPGGYRLAGTTGLDGWIADFSESAGFGLSRRYAFEESGTDWLPEFHRIAAVPGGGHVVGGLASPGISNQKRRFVMRVDAAGDVLWAKLLGRGLLESAFFDLDVADDGTVVVMGRLDEGSFERQGLEVNALDLSGNVLWTATHLDNLDFIHDTARLTVTANAIHIVGTKSVNLPTLPADLSIWTKRLSLLSGSEIHSWVQGQEYDGALGFGTTDSDQVADVISVGTRVWVCGSTDVGGLAGWIWNSSVGVQLAQAGVYATSGADLFTRMRALPDGGLLTLGFSTGFTSAGNNMIAVRSGALPLVELDPAQGASTTPAAFRDFDAPASLIEDEPVDELTLNATVTDVAVSLFGSIAAQVTDIER